MTEFLENSAAGIGWGFLVFRTNFAKEIWFSMCLLVVLGLQGIVVKCTASILFLTMD